MTRPSETITAIVGNVVGAVLIVLGLFTDTSKITTEAAGAIVTLISNVAWFVTLIVAKAQRAGTKTSADDGTVH